MSEAQEAVVRQQALLMIERNQGRPHILRRVVKRFLKCLKS